MFYMQLKYCFDLGMKFFVKPAYQLLNSMFQIDDIHVMGAFLHPNYRTLKSATSTQIDDCHQSCCMVITTNAECDITEEYNEEQSIK
jgi:glutathione peroxidase-family protein